MKVTEWNEGMNCIDSDLVENHIKQKEKLQKRDAVRENWWIGLSAAAACLCLVVGIAWGALLKEGKDPNPPLPSDQSNGTDLPLPPDPITSETPKYYGSAYSMEDPRDMSLHVGAGLSVTAKLIEVLPDTYTFFDDWGQQHYRLLRMETVKLLRGREMAERFFYLVPLEFMTDFTLYDRFVLCYMEQCTYESPVLYNCSRGCAEQLDLAIMGYTITEVDVLGSAFMAFDSEGQLDLRLWNSNDLWKEETKSADIESVKTLALAEQKASNEVGGYSKSYFRSLNLITGEAAETLVYVQNLENGLYVPKFSVDKLHTSQKIQFHARRYINGFPTNERVGVWSQSTPDCDSSLQWTKAKFYEEDLAALPDLEGAMAAVIAEFEAGKITPPHIVNYENLTLEENGYGICAGYFKTAEGVIGVVAVNWRYQRNQMDNAYYIVEYGEEQCHLIDRDALLERIGAYGAYYDTLDFIYQGEYDSGGQVKSNLPEE